MVASVALAIVLTLVSFVAAFSLIRYRALQEYRAQHPVESTVYQQQLDTEHEKWKRSRTVRYVFVTIVIGSVIAAGIYTSIG